MIALFLVTAFVSLAVGYLVGFNRSMDLSCRQFHHHIMRTFGRAGVDAIQQSMANEIEDLMRGAK